MNTNIGNQSLSLGNVYATSNIASINDHQFIDFVNASIIRHKNIDFGDLEEEDVESNLYALQTQGRILSSYNLPNHLKGLHTLNDKIWIITEWDRSITTVLFPSEY